MADFGIYDMLTSLKVIRGMMVELTLATCRSLYHIGRAFPQAAPESAALVAA